MRFLADMGVSMTTVDALRQAGEDVVHLRDEGLHRLPDNHILGKARREQRIVLTFDLISAISWPRAAPPRRALFCSACAIKLRLR